MKILVTGCNGQLGKTVLANGTKYGFSIIGYSRENLDITSQVNIFKIFKFEKPDLIINTAAYTKVDYAEVESVKAFEINEKGTLYLSQICSNLNIPLLHISTDYVFDGKFNEPYTEINKTCPINIYGRSKESGEQIIKKNIKQHIILRTSWVFSEHGNNFVNTIINLANKKKESNKRKIISIVSDQTGGPTSTDGISEALLSIAYEFKKKKSIEWGTYNFSGYPYITWYNFANEILNKAYFLKLIKEIPKIKPINSSDYPTMAKRPLNSRLNCDKIYKNFKISMDDWKNRLHNYLTKIKHT